MSWTAERSWKRHQWGSRVVVTDLGTVPCECAWWKRLWYLATRR